MAKLTDYMMTAEAAEILGVAQNTIHKWAAQGKIPMHRNPANGYRLFKRSDLQKFHGKSNRAGAASKSERNDVEEQELPERQKEFPQVGPKVSKPSGTLIPSPQQKQPIFRLRLS